MRPTSGWAGTAAPTPLSKSGVGYAGLAEWLKLSAMPLRWRAARTTSPADTLLIVTISLDERLGGARPRILELRTVSADALRAAEMADDPAARARRLGDEVRAAAAETVVNRWLGRIAKAKLGSGASKAERLDIVGQSLVAAPEDCSGSRPSEHPLIAAGAGKAVLVEARNKPSHYVLSDPDLLNNAALKDPGEGGRGAAR